MNNLLELKEQIIKSINQERLSDVLPYVLEFSEKTGRESLRDLCIKELYGYQQIEPIPDYRKIPVTFFDASGEEIRRHPKGSTLPINEVFRQELYPYNGAIDDFEDLTIERGVSTIITLSKPFSLTIKGKSYEAHSFRYFAKDIKPNIRKLKQLLLGAINEEIIEKPTLGAEVFDFLHPKVTEVSSLLFLGGHFRQAVLDATIELVNHVKKISGLKDLDNTPLMQRAFSIKDPVLELSSNKDIQLGFMWLFSGAVMTMRNVNAHRLDPSLKKEECIEQLYFISHLFKALDKIEK